MPSASPTGKLRGLDEVTLGVQQLKELLATIGGIAEAKFRPPLAGGPIFTFGSVHQGVVPQLLARSAVNRGSIGPFESRTGGCRLRLAHFDLRLLRPCTALPGPTPVDRLSLLCTGSYVLWPVTGPS